MEYKKVLDNIEPFNDIFYQRCFFNSFFPIANHFKVNVLDIIVNYTNIYKLNEINGISTLDIMYIPDKSLEQLINELGLQAEVKKYSRDLLNDIKSSITDNRPVILWIDSFYEPNRNDTYLKMHLPHTLLVYGFDSSKQECNIIEHKHFENLSYEKMVIGFEDIINSYNGFLDNFIEVENVPTYNEYHLKHIDEPKGEEEQDHLLNLINIMLKNKERYDCSLGALKEYWKFFNFNCGNEFYFKNNAEVILQSFNDIINSKRAERYLLWNLFNNSNSIIYSIDKIAENWSFVRATIARYVFSSVYKEEAFKTSIRKIEEINEFENRLLEMLLKYPS